MWRLLRSTLDSDHKWNNKRRLDNSWRFSWVLLIGADLVFSSTAVDMPNFFFWASWAGQTFVCIYYISYGRYFGGSDDVDSLIKHWNFFTALMYLYFHSEWMNTYLPVAAQIVLWTQTLMLSFAIGPKDRSETQAFEFCSFGSSFTASHSCSPGGKFWAGRKWEFLFKYAFYKCQYPVKEWWNGVCHVAPAS